MSEFRGTPGPWRAEGPDHFGDHNILHPADSLAVAAVVSNMRPAGEVAANARLVAAAPTMLAALRDCQRLLADLARPNGEVCALEIANTWARCIEAETRARAAISLATQEESK